MLKIKKGNSDNLGIIFNISPRNISRVATVREKYLENEFFSKSGNFVDGQGILGGNWKVREKPENLKINGYGRQYSENLFKRVKDVLSHEIV